MLQFVTGGVKRYPSMSYDIYMVYPLTVYFKLQRYKLFGTFKQRLKNNYPSHHIIPYIYPHRDGIQAFF